MQDSQGQGAPSRGENEGPRRAGDLAPQPKTGFNSGKATRALWGALNLGQQCDAELPIVLRGPNWIASRCAALARIEPHRPLHLTVLRCTASHHTALHRPALLCTVLRCSPPRCNLLPSTARTAQCCVALHFSAQCCAALHPLRCWHSSALTHTRCIAPRSTALLCAALPARTAVLPCTAVQKAHLHSTALPLRALHYAASLPCRMLHRIALHCVALRRVALHCTGLRCIALRCIALRCVALHCTALHSAALHGRFIALRRAPSRALPHLHLTSSPPLPRLSVSRAQSERPSPPPHPLPRSPLSYWRGPLPTALPPWRRGGRAVEDGRRAGRRALPALPVLPAAAHRFYRRAAAGLRPRRRPFSRLFLVLSAPRTRQRGGGAAAGVPQAVLGAGGASGPAFPAPVVGSGPSRAGSGPAPPPRVWSVASLRAAGGRGAACVRRRAGRGCASKRAERCSGLGAPARVAVRVSRLIQRLVPLPARLSIRFL